MPLPVALVPVPSLHLCSSNSAHICGCGSKMGEFKALCIHQNLLFLPQYKARMLGADLG